MKELKQSAEFTMDQSSELVGMESDALITAMELAEDAIAGLAGLESVAAVSLNDGGASVETASALIAGYNGIMTPFDVVMSGVAVESFDSTVYSVIGTEGIIDTIKKTTAKIWNAIKEFLQKWWDKAVEFYDKHISALGNLTKATAALKEKIDKSELTDKKHTHIVMLEAIAKEFTVDGTLNANVEQVYNEFYANITYPMSNTFAARDVLQSQLDLISVIDFKTATGTTIKKDLNDKGLSYDKMVELIKGDGSSVVNGDTTTIELKAVFPGNNGLEVSITKHMDEDIVANFKVTFGVLDDSYEEVKEAILPALSKAEITKAVSALSSFLGHLEGIEVDAKALKASADEYETALSTALSKIDKDTSADAAKLIKLYVKGSKGLSLSIMSPPINMLRQGIRTASAGYTWTNLNFKNLK